MRALPYFGLVLGLALAIALIGFAGAGTVIDALARAGWNMGWVALYYVLPLALASMGWRRLFVGAAAPTVPTAMRAAWIGAAVNWLLPVAQVGGEFVRARLVMKVGIPGTEAGASVVIDKTVQATNVVLFGTLGLVILVSLDGDLEMLPATAAFLLVLAALIFTFYRIQHAGLFGYLANRLPARGRRQRWERLVGGAEALDEAIRAVYRQPRRVVQTVVLRFSGRLLLAGEMWLALHFLGFDVSVAEAIMLESLGQAIRGGAFFVPGALGVQEGSFMVLAPLVGLGPETGLAVSLVKRAREVLVGIPALVSWQISEGRWLWQGRRAAR